MPSIVTLFLYKHARTILVRMCKDETRCALAPAASRNKCAFSQSSWPAVHKDDDHDDDHDDAVEDDSSQLSIHHWGYRQTSKLGFHSATTIEPRLDRANARLIRDEQHEHAFYLLDRPINSYRSFFCYLHALGWFHTEIRAIRVWQTAYVSRELRHFFFFLSFVHRLRWKSIVVKIRGTSIARYGVSRE